MARLEYFVVAESVLNDSETNLTSLVNVYEEISSPVFPLVIPKIAAIALWRPSEKEEKGKEYVVKLKVYRPDGATDEFVSGFQFVTGARAHRVVFRLLGLPIPNDGELIFEVLLNDEKVATHSVPVIRSSLTTIANLSA